MKKNLLLNISITVILLFVSTIGILYYIDSFETQNYRHFLKNQFYEEEKNQAKIRVKSVINIIKELEKEKILNDNLLKNIVDSLKVKDTYVFIEKILNLDENKFAIMLANPNRKDLEGKKIDINFQDTKGNKFRKKMVELLKKFGKGFVEYYYTTPNGEVSKKITYFERYKNYIVASGFYEKDILLKLSKYIEPLNINNLKIHIRMFVLILLITIIGIVYLNFILNKFITQIEIQQQKQHKKELNNILQTIHQTTRLQIKETINNIAHKFRQPINSLNAKLIKTKLLIDFSQYDEAKKILDSIENDIINISNEIDNFETITKKSLKEKFEVKKAIEEVLNLVEKDAFKIEININNNAIWNYPENEFKRYFFSLFVGILKNASKIDINIFDNKLEIIAHNEHYNPSIVAYFKTIFENVKGTFDFKREDGKCIFTLKIK